MILDFTAPVTSISGDIQPDGSRGDLTLSRALANHLSHFPGGKEEEAEIFRIIGWGMKLVESGKLDLEEGDIKKLKELIIEAQMMNRLLKYQLLQVCENALDKIKKSSK